LSARAGRRTHGQHHRKHTRTRNLRHFHQTRSGHKRSRRRACSKVEMPNATTHPSKLMQTRRARQMNRPSPCLPSSVCRTTCAR
jgi:hypothetical protein